MNALLPAPSRPARRLRRIAFAASAAALGAGLLLAPSASAADNFGPGYPIPPSSGVGVSHLGAYANVPGVDGLAYCADPDLGGPDTAGGYGPDATVTTWTSNVTGKAISADDLHRAAYILSRYGKTTDDAQAAAVDASVNSYLNPGSTYDLRTGGARGEQRLAYPDVSPDAKTDATNYMDAADKLAGPYSVHIVPQGSVANGKATPFDIYVAAASGNKVPNVSVTLHVTSGDKSATVTYTTDAGGDKVIDVTPADNAGISMTVDANALPSTALHAITPQDSSAQRMVLAGATSTAEAKVTVPQGSSTGTIKVTKTAADTGKPLANVEFAVKDATGKTVATGKTDATGVWQTGQLPAGRYTVHEVKAVVGYQLAADQAVTVTADKTTALAVKDVRIPAPGTPKPRPVTIPQLPQTGA